MSKRGLIPQGPAEFTIGDAIAACLMFAFAATPIVVFVLLIVGAILDTCK